MGTFNQLLRVATLTAMSVADNDRIRAEALAALPTPKPQPDRKRIAAKRRAAVSRRRNRRGI